MQRTKRIKTPDGILTADWHLQESNPICRIDDFVNVTQWKKVQFISDLQKRYGCPILNAGDLFDHWKPSPELIALTLQHLPNKFWSIAGQHDLPQHSLELIKKSGIHVLEKANRLTFLNRYSWGVEPSEEASIIIPLLETKKVMVWHHMVYQGKIPWPDCPAPSAIKVLKKYPQFDLILTGDNHRPFVEEYEGRLLVNPGSIFRTTADQINHEPRVYLWYAESNTVEPVYLPIESGVISREHLEKARERDDRIEAFISRLDNDWDAAISFEENLNRFLQRNEIRQSVKDIINKVLET